MWKVSGAMKRVGIAMSRLRRIHRLPFSLVSLCVAAALTAMLAPGCTTHGEGGRCNPNNKTTTGTFADCDNGLVCTSGLLLSLPEGGTSQADICCPVDRSTSVTDICKGSPVSPGSDAAITDATTDQSADVANDVTGDAPNDVENDASDAASDAPDGD
jgi:hypothetical protein